MVKSAAIVVTAPVPVITAVKATTLTLYWASSVCTRFEACGKTNNNHTTTTTNNNSNSNNNNNDNNNNNNSNNIKTNYKSNNTKTTNNNNGNSSCMSDVPLTTPMPK